MLSRIAFRAGNFVKNVNVSRISPASVGTIRCSASSTNNKEFTHYAESGKRFPWESEERDVVNFPRPVQPEYPGKVRFLFIPEEWFHFFYNKTGVTGPYVLGFGLFNYFMSKEIWIIDHEYYYVYATIFLFALGNHKFGDKIAAWLDKEVDAEEAALKNVRVEELQDLEDSIKEEKLSQWQFEGQKMLIEAKKENVAVQAEAVYRERALQVYNEVKKRLEFHSQKQLMERRVAQKHMVSWIIDQVLKSITPQQEKETLKKCLVDLQALASRA